MTSNYARGANLERDIMKALQADGYWCVRAAGSKGEVDVIGLKPRQIVLVQAKLNGVISPADRVALWDLARRLGGVPIVASRARYRPITWRQLTGTSSKHWVEWVSDEVGAA